MIAVADGVEALFRFAAALVGGAVDGAGADLVNTVKTFDEFGGVNRSCLGPITLGNMVGPFVTKFGRVTIVASLVATVVVVVGIGGAAGTNGL